MFTTLLTGLAAALTLQSGDLPPNAPELCEYLPNAQALADSPFLSLGGFEFGRTTTAEVDALLTEVTIYWVETEHFEVGYALGSYKVPAKEARPLRDELELFQMELESVPLKPKTLDPWLRALLYAWRFERVYDKVQGYLGVTDADFPAPHTVWDTSGKFMGTGPHLGQSGKYEVLMLPGTNVSQRYLRETFGLLVEHTQRWNVIDRDSLIVVMNDAKSSMRRDPSLYGHLAYNLGIQLLDGYKHYNYEIPCYLRSGMGHLLEREITRDHSTFDISEGGDEIDFNKSEWLAPLQKLARSGEMPRLAELVNIDAYADMDLDDHLTSWGLTQFFVYSYPEAYAKLLDRICGLTNETGHTDGSDMLRHHREGVQDAFGKNYLELDIAFREWLEGPQASELNDPKRPDWR